MKSRPGLYALTWPASYGGHGGAMVAAQCAGQVDSELRGTGTYSRQAAAVRSRSCARRFGPMAEWYPRRFRSRQAGDIALTVGARCAGFVPVRRPNSSIPKVQ